MRDSHCLDTDLKLRSVLTGTCDRIWINRSSLEATLAADAIGEEDSSLRSREMGEGCLDVRLLLTPSLTTYDSMIMC